MSRGSFFGIGLATNLSTDTRGGERAMEAAIRTIRALSDEEALAWLRANSPVTQSNAALARVWGWNATKVSRRLKAWQEAGTVNRTKLGITAIAPSPVAPPEPPPSPAAPASTTARAPDQAAALTLVIRCTAVVLAATALTLGAVGL